MKRLSPRTVAAFTNLILVCIVLFVGAVCFFPVASPASGTEEKAIYEGNSTDGVSLMFNVYWGTEEVNGILGVLKEYGATATFFIGGSWADDNVETVRAIANEGHEIGSHGYFHRDHDKLSYDKNLEEIRTSVEFLEAAIGKDVTLFAPPSGAYNDDTISAAASLGCKTIMWSKDTIDWRDKDAAVCLRRATEGVKGGDLILMHPMAHTLQALPAILDYYRAQGLRAITVGENVA